VAESTAFLARQVVETVQRPSRRVPGSRPSRHGERHLESVEVSSWNARIAPSSSSF